MSHVSTRPPLLDWSQERIDIDTCDGVTSLDNTPNLAKQPPSCWPTTLLAASTAGAAATPAPARAGRPAPEQTQAAQRSHAALADRRTALWAVASAVAGRLLAFAVAFSSSYWLGARLRHNPLAASSDLTLDRHPLGFLLSAWGHWDGIWFVRIAEHGYSLKKAAFFPLYPVAMRAVSAVVGRPDLAGILVSMACYAAALVILYRLVKEEFDARTALWAVVLLSFAPTSLFFQAVYSESLFLLLTVASFAAGRKGHWLLAGAAGLLAALTRSAGLILVVPLAWMWLEQRRGRAMTLPGSVTRLSLLANRPAKVSSLGWLLLVPAGLGLFMAYTLVRFHNALLFMAAQHYWNRRFSLPGVAVIDGARAAIRSVRAIVARPDVFFDISRLPFLDGWLTIGNLTAFLALVFAVALLVVCWRRLPASYTVFAIVSLLLPLSYPTHSTPLLSLPRFVLVDFPLFIALAVVLVTRPVARWTVLAAMVAGLILLTTIFANGMWVA